MVKDSDRILQRARAIAENELHLEQRRAALRNSADTTFSKRLVVGLFAKYLVRDEQTHGYRLDDRDLVRLLSELGAARVSPEEFSATQKIHERQRR